MLPFLDSLRVITYENSVWVSLLRLGVAALCGGIIGIERGRKRRPAGFRTHMLVCIGAALAMMISQYLSMMAEFCWINVVNFEGQKFTDASRFGAQVINGIGFLGAGTIIVTGQQEVKGLTTAAGLWAAACMGLCIGAGFVEGALVGCALIVITIVLLSRMERFILRRARDVNFYVQLSNVDDVGAVISTIKGKDVRIFDVEIQKAQGLGSNPGAIFSVRLPAKMSHATLLSLVAGVDNVRSIEEL